jgi:predicted DNA-binding transcriptional regulator AlpA
MKNHMNGDSCLISAGTLAGMLAISVRSVWRYRSAGKLPKPLEVGASLRWRLDDVRKWISLGCPDQKRFEILKGGEE